MRERIFGVRNWFLVFVVVIAAGLLGNGEALAQQRRLDERRIDRAGLARIRFTGNRSSALMSLAPLRSTGANAFGITTMTACAGSAITTATIATITPRPTSWSAPQSVLW